MGFINLIKNINPIIELKQEIKKNRLPGVLYGAGETGERIHDFLKANGINIDAVVVDKEYLSTEQTVFFKGKKVYSIEEIVKKYASINLFVSFYADDLPSLIRRKAEMIAKKGPIINKVYMFDDSLVRNPERILNYQFLIDNIKEFDWLHNVLADQRSKDVLIAFLNQRISMQIGELNKICDNNQYFHNSLVNFGFNEVYIDCGAYDGDTVQQFIDALSDQNISRYKKIYAFEPDSNNYQELCKNCKHLNNIILINQGAWSKEGTLKFSGNKQMRSMIAESGENTVDVTTIDNLLSGEKATFIKMDIQGAEYEALRGACDTIKKYSPNIAICVYHNNQDLITIPKFLYSINSYYNFYLRAHAGEARELVLYCITE